MAANYNWKALIMALTCLKKVCIAQQGPCVWDSALELDSTCLVMETLWA